MSDAFFLRDEKTHEVTLNCIEMRCLFGDPLFLTKRFCPFFSHFTVSTTENGRFLLDLSYNGLPVCLKSTECSWVSGLKRISFCVVLVGGRVGVRVRGTGREASLLFPRKVCEK